PHFLSGGPSLRVEFCISRAVDGSRARDSAFPERWAIPARGILHFPSGEISDGKGLHLPVDEENRKYLDENGYEDQEIIFGIRPEHVHEYVEDADTSLGKPIPAKITVSE